MLLQVNKADNMQMYLMHAIFKINLLMDKRRYVKPVSDIVLRSYFVRCFIFYYLIFISSILNKVSLDLQCFDA